MPSGFANLMGGAAQAADDKAKQEMPAPPPKDPEAPFGRTKDGKPKRGPGGRPSAEKPRVQAPTAAQAPAVVRDYTQDLAELTEGVWFLMAQLPPTQAQAAILKVHRPALVHGWALAAQNNAMIRSGVDMLTGKGTWVAAVAMATAPFVMQSLALWTKTDEELAAGGMATKEELAASTVRELEDLTKQQEQALAAAVAAGM
jgi:hypothetical protein